MGIKTGCRCLFSTIVISLADRHSDESHSNATSVKTIFNGCYTGKNLTAGEILFLLGSLDRKFREKKHLRLSRCTSHVSAVISSELYERCSKILQTMKASDIEQELSDLLTQSHVQPPRPGLPPLSSDALKLRVEEIRTHDATEFYLIQLPEPSASQPFRRSGLILRQHLVDGEIKNLFVAGVERGSPADSASGRLENLDTVNLSKSKTMTIESRLTEEHQRNKTDENPSYLVFGIFRLALPLFRQPWITCHYQIRCLYLLTAPILVVTDTSPIWFIEQMFRQFKQIGVRFERLHLRGKAAECTSSLQDGFAKLISGRQCLIFPLAVSHSPKQQLFENLRRDSVERRYATRSPNVTDPSGIQSRGIGPPVESPSK
ncbi:discs lost-related protein [Clonorchis sinensis]|uniref:Discs lost-related protein n=1 Tax=Clonorchis sinensis TaxID=79923 RepID=G7YN50_CLOSI|nr:discs lost-related protein [Clonorchis sinensis]